MLDIYIFICLYIFFVDRSLNMVFILVLLFFLSLAFYFFYLHYTFHQTSITNASVKYLHTDNYVVLKKLHELSCFTCVREALSVYFKVQGLIY